MTAYFGPNNRRRKSIPFNHVWKPIQKFLPSAPLLESRGDRPLQMTFEDQLKILFYFHLQEHKSGRHLLQDLVENNIARREIAPPKGIKKSSFFEALNTRGIEQLFYIFEQLQAQAASVLPSRHSALGELVALDGSLIDAVLSMHWADFKKGKRKAKVHLGFDLNHGIPYKLFLTGGAEDERPFVSKIISPGQTGVLDRYYQKHRLFDQWQEEGKHFVCRLRNNTQKSIIRKNDVPPGGIVFYDAIAMLGANSLRFTEKEVRVVGYRAGGKEYWVATDRFDLSAEEIAQPRKPL